MLLGTAFIVLLGMMARFTEADVIVVNTCAFIDRAKQESVDAILEMAALKEQGEHGIAGAGLGRSAHEEPESSTP